MCLCVCLCRKLSRVHSLPPLKIKHRNMQCKLNAILSWNEIGEFWIGGSIGELWRDLHWSPGWIFFCCPKSVEEQAVYNKLLFNLAVLSGQWATCKLNLDKPGRWRYTGYLSSRRDLVIGPCPDGRRGPAPCSSSWRCDSIAYNCKVSPHANCTTKSSVYSAYFLLLWFEQATAA